MFGALAGSIVKKLRLHNINTAFDFVQKDAAWVQKQLTIVGLRLQQDLKGIATLDLEMVQPKKNIATTRSFDTNYTEFEQVNERVSTFAVSCAEKLRKQKSVCHSLMVFIHTNRFRNDLPQYSRNIVLKLPYATNSALELAQFAEKALKLIFKTGFHYKKAGVIVHDIVPESNVQINLFENTNLKHKPLMVAMDKLNNIFGQQKIRLASQDMNRVWKMKQEKLSPKYTTNINDVITIHL